MSNTISDKLYSQCRSDDSITAELEKKPSGSPAEFAKHLYGSHGIDHFDKKPPEERLPATQEDLRRAAQCGRFAGTNPSELFLRAYHDMLLSLQHDPLGGVVSPSLLGSTGVVPLTTIGPLHDVARHLSNVIVRAKKEVLLATCSWLAGGSTSFISDALRELSRRAGQRGERIVVKIIYDRGGVKQVTQHHQILTPKEYTAEKTKLPAPEEIPHIDMQVTNFHRPLLGTFHSKFMIVDRQYACVSSNNLQDNDNTEMMTHLEGPIVDCLWDTFLCSWHNAMTPPPPCMDRTASSMPIATFEEESFGKLFDSQGRFRVPNQESINPNLPEHRPGDPHYDDDIAGEIARMHTWLSPKSRSETGPQIVARHLNHCKNLDVAATDPTTDPNLHYFPYFPTAPHARVPMALANRKPFGTPNHSNIYVPQNECFLSLVRNAKSSIFIQTPDLNSHALLPNLVAAAKRGVDITYYVCLGYNDAGELMPGQGGINETVAHNLFEQLQPGVERDRLKVHFYIAADQDHPIHNSFKQRSCHIKLLIVDEQVAVQGSGNQDTQSWYQSQEVNVMIDSPDVCRSWRQGIDRNQNTRKYGQARQDGCWYDREGKLAVASMGYEVKFPWVKGVKGMIEKVKRTGGV